MSLGQPGRYNIQEFTDGGDPLVGGRVYTYDAGTTTHKAAYTDKSGLVPHTYTSDGAGGQFIALNSRGELPAPLFLTSGDYDITLKRADGSSVWTRRAVSTADPTFATISDLRAAGVPTTKIVVYVEEHTAGYGTDGGGVFYWAPTSNEADDNFRVIKPSSNPANGRWKRGKTGPFNPKMAGAKGDESVYDTSAVQAIINHAQTSGDAIEGMPGTYKCQTLTISKPIRWEGAKPKGPIYGVDTGYAGFVISYKETSGDALKIDASGLLNNQGLNVTLRHIQIDGNKDVLGATGGGGINLIGDKTGETYFVMGSIFDDVHVRKAKGDAWTITGTCFLNNWYNCGGSYSGGKGMTHDKGASGAPTNNNFHNCNFDDNAGVGFNCNGGKSTLNTCNISQNAGGGVSQDGGYLIMADCDLEQNTGTYISVTNSSGATMIRGGMIHKTPGTAAATAISWGAGCAGNHVEGTLFANFDHASDRLLAFSGGASLQKFDYRAQNNHANAFPTSLWTSIADIPAKEKLRRGSVSMPGTGPDTRTVTLNFTTLFGSPFEVGYTIIATASAAGGIDPSQVEVFPDYSTQTLNTINLVMRVNGVGYGAIDAHFIIPGR